MVDFSLKVQKVGEVLSPFLKPIPYALADVTCPVLTFCQEHLLAPHLTHKTVESIALVIGSFLQQSQGKTEAEGIRQFSRIRDIEQRA